MIADIETEGLMPGQRWYVARTLPHKERTASERMRAQGFRTFLPLQDRTIRHARRILTVRRPIFPRYLFVRFDPGATQWRSINGTIGVDRLIMRGTMPEAVRDGVVETLLASADEEDRLQFTETLKPGDTVRLLHGPFADQLGQLQHLGASDRVQVLLSFLGGPVPVHVKRASLARVR